MRLWLASRSPRRSELLAAAGFRFEVDAADIDETPRAREDGRAYVERLAREKAAVVATRHPDDLVLAADTEVVLDGDVFGKPANDEEAGRMLRRLAGRDHLVLTGITLQGCGKVRSVVEETRVYVSNLTESDVEWYVRTGEALDKAGAYAIQGRFSRFVPRIEGSYTNVVGLPVEAVARLIREGVF